MTAASARLRELDERMTAGPWEMQWGGFMPGLSAPNAPGVRLMVVAAEEVAALRNALPALTAAIEAAEHAEDQLRSYGAGVELVGARHLLRDALAALSAALAEGGA